MTSVVDLPETKPMFLFIQMELCQGQTLQYYLTRKKKVIEEHMAFYIFSQLVDALEYIHKQDIVHRDIKPGNIFLS